MIDCTLLKLKYSVVQKTLFRTKQTIYTWENRFANHGPDKRRVPRIHTETLTYKLPICLKYLKTLHQRIKMESKHVKEAQCHQLWGKSGEKLMRDTMRKARRNTHKPTHSTRRPDPAVQSRQQPQATGTGSPCREEGADTQGSSLTILRKPHTHFPFNWPSPSFYGMKHPCEIKTHFHMRACM